MIFDSYIAEEKAFLFKDKDLYCCTLEGNNSGEEIWNSAWKAFKGRREPKI